MKSLLRNLSLFVAVPSLMMGALSGCGGDDNSGGSDTPQTTPPAQLVQSDLQSLPTISTAGFQRFDDATNGTFSLVFGGTTANDLVQYLNDRVHYFLTKDDDASIYPATFQNDGWEKDGDSTGDAHRLRSGSFLGDSTAVLGALNIGTAYWLDGLINNVAVTFRLGNQYVPVDSSRVGIVLLGPGYTDKMQDEDGNWMDLPAFYRQGILLHEARHSDCTGGVSEADLNVARNATSAQQFAQETKMTACGHLHSFCPADVKPYAGLPACDSEAWGAYRVEETFLAAMSLADLSEVDHNIALSQAIDRKSRVQMSKQALEEAGAPDMSTAGLRDDH